MRVLLLPFAWIYWLVVRLRNLMYDIKIFKSRPGALPAIVIGNVTVGGTGKTPHTVYIVNQLSGWFKTGVLSRGYGRKTKDCRIVRENSTTAEVGDEPKLIFNATRVPVVVCGDRLQGLEFLKKHFPGTQLAVLDDGFQHRQLKPAVTILLIDWNRPPHKDLFLPAGNLRDNVYRIKQADMIVFTKCPADLDKDTALSTAQKLAGKDIPVFFTAYRPVAAYNPETGEEIDTGSLKNYEILAFSGLADNGQFRRSLVQLGKNVVFTSFPDHYEYKPGDIKKIFYRFAKIHSSHKIILTTEKDYVKLRGLLNRAQRANVYTLKIEIKFLFDGQNIFNKKIYDYGRKLVGKN